jgi:hypothetical protein
VESVDPAGGRNEPHEKLGLKHEKWGFNQPKWGFCVCVCSYMMFASKIEISVVKNANE